MNTWLKKFIISFLSTTVFYFIIYFVIGLYDQTWQTILWFYNNLYYISFLFISIVWWLTLYWNNDNKSKLIISMIFLINFVYLVFLFSLSNMWLNQIQWIFLIWFLLLWLVSTNLKNRIWNSIISLCIFWIFITIFSVLIPLYQEWPDIVWFEKNFKTQFIVYSRASLNTKTAVIEKDKREYKLSNGIYNYEFKIPGSWSEIIFKSDKQYQNSFGYILFSNKDILQIYPQSAIKINKDFEIEIITWIIKYFPQETKNFSFTWNLVPSIMVDQQNIDILLGRYDNELKKHILEKSWWNIHKNKTILSISKKTLEILNKIFPKKFEKNLENFEMFDKYLEYNLDQTKSLETFDQKNIQKWMIKDIKDWLNSTKIIK